LAGGGPTVPGPAPGTSDVGTVGIHQLSAREYNNTVRDLVGTALKPGDGFQSFEAAGFDTLAAAGVMNSRKVSDYFAAATTLAQETLADPTRRAAIVTCQPAGAGDTTCAESIIKAFGTRAFRRPLDTAEVADFVVRYQAALAQQLDHVGAIQQIVRIMLASPQFIYRVELDPDATTVHALSGYELASRMSYLLWSSMPDATLFTAAANNELAAPEKLVAQVDRMLADKRSSELADNFAAQWLGSRRLSGHVVDTALFPAWTPALGVSMQQEMSAYFDDFLHGQQTYDKFLTSQVNFVDSNLAKFYGLPDPGPALTRTPNASGNRVGFLGLAGFLTHTSRPDRTAPSIRGKWVLGSIKCQELQLPTNIMVPELEPPAAGQTVRQALEAHRGKPACAPCHNVLDPIGLGLEHFDAIGAYRDTYSNGLPVDAKATLPDGTNVDGIAQLADALSKDPAVVACAAHKLFVYGLGRTTDGSEGHLEQIVAGWQARGLTLANLLKELVVNDTFRARHGNGN